VDDALLTIEDLSVKLRGSRGVVHAVRGLGLTVHRSEIIALVGESGCGKTVTALSILRLLPPDALLDVSGTVIFDRQNLLTMPPKQLRQIRGRRISMVFQDPSSSLNPRMTVGNQVSEALRLTAGMSRAQARERSAELLDQVGIPGAGRRIDDYPHQFSGGMRQRVMLAMAISQQPSLIIADEPTTSLDMTIQAQILELLGQLRRDLSTSLLLITHDLGVAAAVADRVAVVYAGMIVETGQAKDVLLRPAHPYTHGLVQSLPRIDQDRRRRFPAIPGAPPDLRHHDTGCAFKARCAWRVKHCDDHEPPLTDTAPGQSAACWRAPVDFTAGSSQS
jgi:oligopeptide transport system ATP-binding protein